MVDGINGSKVFLAFVTQVQGGPCYPRPPSPAPCPPSPALSCPLLPSPAPRLTLAIHRPPSPALGLSSCTLALPLLPLALHTVPRRAQEYINKVDGKGALGQNDNCRKEFNHAVREKGPELMIPVLMEHGDARDDSARANARPSVAGAATSSVGSESPHDSAGESPGGTASGAATAAATGAGTCSLTSTKNWGKTIQFNIGNHLYTDLSDLNFDFGPPHEADEAFQQKMAELEKAVRKVMREASQPNSQPGRSGKLPSSGRVSSELPLSGRASGKGRAASTHRSARAVSFVELHDAGGAAGAGHPGGSPSQRM